MCSEKWIFKYFKERRREYDTKPESIEWYRKSI